MTNEELEQAIHYKGQYDFLMGLINQIQQSAILELYKAGEEKRTLSYAIDVFHPEFIIFRDRIIERLTKEKDVAKAELSKMLKQDGN